MTKLHLHTAAFTPAKSIEAGGRSKKVASRPRREYEIGVAQNRDAEAVRVELEVETRDGSLVIMVETPDSQVTPALLKEGILTILKRESQLEQTAGRYGLPADALLDALADSIVDVSDESVGLPEAEFEVLRAVGISLGGSPTDPSGVGQVALGLARSRQFREDALTVAEAAEELGVSTGRVRQLVSGKAVMTILSGDGRHLLPAWQFTGGRLLPGLTEVAEAGAGLHPMTLAGFITHPDVDLDVEGQPVSPIEWLVAGGDPTVVVDLVAGLRVPA